MHALLIQKLKNEKQDRVGCAIVIAEKDEGLDLKEIQVSGNMVENVAAQT